MIYKATENLRAIQILLGHSKIKNTVRYLGVDVEEALLLAERTERVIRSVRMTVSPTRIVAVLPPGVGSCLTVFWAAELG